MTSPSSSVVSDRVVVAGAVVGAPVAMLVGLGVVVATTQLRSAGTDLGRQVVRLAFLITAAHVFSVMVRFLAATWLRWQVGFPPDDQLDRLRETHHVYLAQDLAVGLSALTMLALPVLLWRRRDQVPAHRRRLTEVCLALAVVATYLVFMTAAETSGVVVLLLWIALIAIAVPLLVADVRRKYFSGPMFDWFKKVLPPISATERDAIDAGTVWWDGELFSGRPDWDTLLGYPKARLTDEEQKPSANWSANGISPSAWTCRPPPGTTSRPKASLP